MSKVASAELTLNTDWRAVEAQAINSMSIHSDVPANETPEERARRIGVPYVQPIKLTPFRGPNPVVAVCGGCGRDVHMVEGYSCPHSNCPIQPRITSMSTGDIICKADTMRGDPDVGARSTWS